MQKFSRKFGNSGRHFKEGKVTTRKAPTIKDREGNENRFKAALLRTSKYLVP